MDVSATIQMHHYTAHQPKLVQQRMDYLSEAAENAVDVLAGAYARAVNLLAQGGSAGGFNANIIDSGSSGRGLKTAFLANTKVLLLNVPRPTTAPEQLVDLDEYKAEDGWTRWTGQANEALQNAASTVRRQTTAVAIWRVERLSSLQAAFGFTIQDLAAILGITRPQLYKWLDAANSIKLQEASRARMATVERIAREWSSRTKVPLSSLSKETLAAGGTVFALMSAEVIDDRLVIGAFDELIAKIHEEPKSRSQLLREAGFARRPSVHSLPSDE